MKHLALVQGSAAWLQSRIGRITASRMVDVLNIRKDGKPGADQLRYFSEVLCERLSGVATDHYVSPAMEHGTELEPFARTAYELETGEDVEQVGLVLHSAFDWLAASPDGLVGAHGMVEFKAPTTIKHVSWLLADEVPDEHKAQMFTGMACCERDWCDFCSIDLRLPKPLQMFKKRLMWDQEEVDKIELGAMAFNASVNSTIDVLRKRFGDFALPEQIAAKVQSQEGYLTDEDFAGLV